MRPPSLSPKLLAHRRHSRILAAAAVLCVVWLALRGRQGDNPGSGAGEAQHAPSAAGWSESYLHKAGDAKLTALLDRTSKASPLMKCTADLHIFKLKADDLERVNDGAKANRSTLGPLLSGTAHRMPCRHNLSSARASCCSYPVNFRLGTTDFQVFQQVFQFHYMRYLYTLFADQPPQYVLDAGANAGFASSLFKLLWPDATVVSLEPDTSNFELLKANTKSFKKVHALNAGLWGHRANITMVMKSSSHGNWGRVFREAQEGEEGMPAYGVQDIADMLDIPAFDFVKIDIEGAEGMVFEPGNDFSWIGKARAVSLEIHDYFAGYFDLKPNEVSSRVDAAFNTTGYSLVSDNEHVIFLSPALRKAVESSAAAVPHTESAAAEQAKQGKKHKAAEQPQGTQRAKQSGSGA